jgi:hypothetical protein
MESVGVTAGAAQDVGPNESMANKTANPPLRLKTRVDRSPSF